MLLQTDIISNKIKSLDQVLKLMKIWRMKNQKVVFTNGVFDILHPGHISYLAKTKDLGDRLILGLNSDTSVKMLNKGPNRPIQNENDRAFLLAALSVIDAVVIFNEETPYELIKAIVPDVLAKGGDYKVEQIAGHDIVLNSGGSVEIVDFLVGHSTTSIEQKIKQFKD
jgi:rfaE bifunctional protein nucleotidyltransferase chain/domain